MKITWIGHSCFKIESNAYTLILDPYADGSVPGLAPMREKGNEILCTHDHSDHNGRENVTLVGEKRSPFSIQVLKTYHDDVKGAKRGPNQMFILDDGESRVAHLGDLGCDLTKDQQDQLKQLDVMMIPVGGYFTIDKDQAVQVVQECDPRIVIPIHYRSDEEGFGFDVLDTVESFAAKWDQVTRLKKSSIESTDSFSTQVVILSPQNREKKD